MTIEVVVACLDAKDGVLGDLWKSVKLSYTDERLAAVKRDGVTIGLTVPVRSLARNVKVIAYDYTADRVGRAIVKVEGVK